MATSASVSAVESQNAVFVITSLGTHLAATVSDSDTVSDLKKKLLRAHSLCFPSVGGIRIHSLKVKRRGQFYHLLDSMLVKSAFQGLSKGWFLTVDASSILPNGNPLSENVGACLAIMDSDLADGVDNLKRKYRNRKRSKTIKERKAQTLNSALEEKDASGLVNNKSVVPDNFLLAEDKIPDREMHIAVDEVQMATRNSLPGNHVEVEKNTLMNLSVDEASPGPAMKKQKTMNGENSLQENKNNSTNAITRPELAGSQDSLLVKDVNGMTVLPSSEISKDNQLLTNSPKNRKRKRKVHGPEVGKQEVTSVPTSAENERVENASNIVAGHHKDSERELSAVDEKVISGAMVSEPSSVRDEDKLPVSVQEVEAKNTVIIQEVGADNQVPQSVDEDMSVVDSGNAEDTNITPEAAVASAVKGTRISGDLHTIGTEGDGLVPVQHGNDLKDGRIVEPAKSSKRKKKSKKAQDPVFVPVSQGKQDTTAIETQSNPSTFLQGEGKDTGFTEQAGSDQLAQSEAEQKLSEDNDHKATAEGKCTFISNEIDVNTKVGVTTDLLDANNLAEPEKSSKKRKKTAISKPFSGGEAKIATNVEMTSTPLGTNGIEEPEKSSKRNRKSKKNQHHQHPVTEQEVTDHNKSSVTLSEQHEVVPNDHSNEKSGNKNTLFPSDENEGLNAEGVDATSLATDKEVDNVIQHVLEALQDLSENPIRAESEGKKSRKKTKKKRGSSSKSALEMQNENETICYKNAGLAGDVTRELEVEASSILLKTNLSKTSTDNQNPSDRKLLNEAEVKAYAIDSEVNVKSPQALLHEQEASNEERPIQDKNSNLLQSGRLEKVNAHAEVLRKDDRTIVNDNFVPSQNQPEAVVSAEAPDNKASNKVEASKDQNKLDLHSNSPSLESERTGEKAQVDDLKNQSGMKHLEISAVGRKVPPASNKSEKSNSKTKKTMKQNAVSNSRTTNHSNQSRALAASNSSLESSRKRVPQKRQVNSHQPEMSVKKKTIKKDNGEILDGSERKSLLAKSGSIFKDNDWSSDGEGVDNSDASTRTPSDNSLSSDYSDGDSSAPQGSYSSPKTKNQRRRNISKSHSGMNLETILKSSSRFKAAKLTASQSEPLDFDSQPDEFVPESQPDQ